MKPILALYLLLGAIGAALVGSGLMCIFSNASAIGFWLLTIAIIVNVGQAGVIAGYMVTRKSLDPTDPEDNKN